MFWIHGGGWQTGDKSSVQIKPQFFLEKGRLEALIVRTVPDVHKAIRWNTPFFGVEGQALLA